VTICVDVPLSIIGFDPESHRMRVEALHPGVTLDEIRANTGFELLTAPSVATTDPPAPDEFEARRALDPERRFLA